MNLLLLVLRNPNSRLANSKRQSLMTFFGSDLRPDLSQPSQGYFLDEVGQGLSPEGVPDCYLFQRDLWARNVAEFGVLSALCLLLQEWDQVDVLIYDLLLPETARTGGSLDLNLLLEHRNQNILFFSDFSKNTIIKPPPPSSSIQRSRSRS